MSLFPGATRVVHVNSPEFRHDPTAIYIGRAVNRAKDPRCRVASTWANPYHADSAGGIAGAIEDFETMMRQAIQKKAPAAVRLGELRGKVLGCWCHPKPCHGDVLVKLIRELWPETP